MVSASKDRLSLEQFLDLRSSVSMPLMGYMGPINSKTHQSTVVAWREKNLKRNGLNLD